MSDTADHKKAKSPHARKHHGGKHHRGKAAKSRHHEAQHKERHHQKKSTPVPEPPQATPKSQGKGDSPSHKHKHHGGKHHRGKAAKSRHHKKQHQKRGSNQQPICQTLNTIMNLAQKEGKDIERSAIAFTLGYIAGIKHKKQIKIPAQTPESSCSRNLDICHGGADLAICIKAGDVLSDLQKTLTEKFKITPDWLVVGFLHAPSQEHVSLRVALHDPSILREGVSYSLLLNAVPQSSPFATISATSVTGKDSVEQILELEPDDIFSEKRSSALEECFFEEEAIPQLSPAHLSMTEEIPELVPEGEKDLPTYEKDLKGFNDKTEVAYALGTQVSESFNVTSDLLLGPISENSSVGLCWDTCVKVLSGGSEGSVFAAKPEKVYKPIDPRKRHMCGSASTSLHRWRALAPGTVEIQYCQNYRGTPRGETHIIEVRVEQAPSGLNLIVHDHGLR